MENTEPKYDERKGCGCTLAFLSITAIIISVVALALVEPRTLKINEWGDIDAGFDYLGFIIGVLALMVTLMVGWNIWQTIDAKNAIKGFEEKTKNYEQDLQNKVNAVKADMQERLDSRETALYNHISALLYQTILMEQPLSNQKRLSLYQFLDRTMDSLVLANKQNDSTTIVALLEKMRRGLERAKQQQLSNDEIGKLLQKLNGIGLSETPDKLVYRLQHQLRTFNTPKPNRFDEDEYIED